MAMALFSDPRDNKVYPRPIWIMEKLWWKGSEGKNWEEGIKEWEIEMI